MGQSVRVTRSASKLAGEDVLVEGLGTSKGAAPLMSPRDPRNKGRGRGARKPSNTAVAGTPSPEFSPKLLASSPSSHRMSPNHRGRGWMYSWMERKEINRRGEKE